MITTNVSTLQIHKLTKAQYDREKAAGNLDENALYLTTDEEIDISNYATLAQLEQKADVDHTHDAETIVYDGTMIGMGISNVNDILTTILSGAASIEGAVLYSEEQDLTDEQKAQVMANIGIEIASDDDIIDMIMQEDTLMAVADSDGAILSDESGNILIW